MDLEAAVGFRSTFFFVPENRDVNRDPPYEIDSPRIRDLLGRMHQGGWELGVHGSFASYQKAEFLQAERLKLAQLSKAEIVGVRQHYLRLKVPETFRAQSTAGFRYDTTLGYSDCIGFRAGAAFPFRPFDLDAGRAIPLLELPLTVMDGSLFWGLGLAADQATERVLAILATARSARGLVVLLWHQRVWYDKRYPGWCTVYGRTIEHLCTEDKAWVTTTGQIADWWQAREGVSLEEVQCNGREWCWRYSVERALNGLTLALPTAAADSIKVLGADAIMLQAGDGETHLILGSLLAGQEFRVLLAMNSTTQCLSFAPTREEQTIPNASVGVSGPSQYDAGAPHNQPTFAERSVGRSDDPGVQ
jgi:peptidoglycan/xylan/chitin deacetylase (PgdA/CDA1 family)